MQGDRWPACPAGADVGRACGCSSTTSRPTAVGELVTAEATLERVEGRRLIFTVSVTDHRGLVAAGKVTRVGRRDRPLHGQVHLTASARHVRQDVLRRRSRPPVDDPEQRPRVTAPRVVAAFGRRASNSRSSSSSVEPSSASADAVARGRIGRRCGAEHRSVAGAPRRRTRSRAPSTLRPTGGARRRIDRHASSARRRAASVGLRARTTNQHAGERGATIAAPGARATSGRRTPRRAQRARAR